MGVPEQVRAGQQWFTDQRTVVRRMKVAWHPERRVVVLSLWQGDACTATFRLPIEDAPRLIALLADDLGCAVEAAADVPSVHRSRLRRWWSRVVAKMHHPGADVVDLDEYR